MTNGRTNEDSLISLLLEETYQSLPRDISTSVASDLGHHFDQLQELQSSFIDPTLENFIVRQSKLAINLTYLAQTGCYRLSGHGNEIDFPGNWGPFATMARDISFYNLDQDESLQSILGEVLGPDKKYVLIGQFADVKLVCFDVTDEYSVRWLEKYFMSEEKRKAA